ncbi:MAG: thrombospondin type 3 repeat-containing protein [Luteolibacter sp.]|uniref:thrombospondin type 3 repeat-containing protein n=1 Tax=Luteolibacter sp. TaxID=1962973 RepID=UPI003263514D
MAFVVFLGTVPAEAGLAYWGSEGFVENADSHSRPWTSDFSMELGVFEKGFVPTFENRDQWNEKWSKLDVAEFDAQEARFAGVVDLSQALPAGVDSQVYFWAKNGNDLTKGPEWLLLTRPEWKWPALSAVGSPAITWTTGAPASPVLGEIGANGFHLTSARVVPVPVLLDQWLAGYFPNPASDRNPDADPDGDGLSNRLEYFLGSNPNDGSSRICPEIRTAGNGTTLTLQRNPYAASGFAVETSANLVSWSATDPETIQDRPDLIEVRVPRDPAAKSSFFRIKLQDSQP